MIMEFNKVGPEHIVECGGGVGEKEEASNSVYDSFKRHINLDYATLKLREVGFSDLSNYCKLYPIILVLHLSSQIFHFDYG